MSPPTAYSDLIFSEQANHKFSKTLGELKRSTLSISNRLSSIRDDAVFAQKVADAYGRPLVANERCGSWYIDPKHKAASAYFKSTDGHTGVWKFSTRRLNLHLLELTGHNDGCIIVDSTRRGKRMPDALSKTIPIWCSVLNCLLFPDDSRTHKLYTPPQVVSESENAQIVALLPSFLDSLRSLNISVPDLKRNIQKPIRPFWVTPDSQLGETEDIFENFHPIICCTVSRRVAGGEVSEGGYIQGAGDDTENWAHGLTPTLFWEHQEILLSTPEKDLPDLIEIFVSQAATVPSNGAGMTCLKPTSYIFITPIAEITTKDTGTDACTIALLPKVTEQSTWQITPSRLEIGLGPSKLGSRNLRTALPVIVGFVQKVLLKNDDGSSKGKPIIIACESGRDFSVGVALALLCLYFDDKGDLRKIQDTEDTNMKVNKTFIRQRLRWISDCMPEANPSRATLQSVNSFLMERPL